MSNLSPMRRMRIVLGVFLAVATLTVLISRGLEDPDLETAVASTLAADDRLLEVALEQYTEEAPAIIITYGQLPLFREQLARFGPQVVPIVAAYQQSFTTADAQQRAQEAMQVLQAFLENLPQLAEEALQALRQATSDFLESLWQLLEPGADAPEFRGEVPDPNEEQAATENDAVELDGLLEEDRGLIAPLLDWLASWFESAQRLIALLLDWSASWFESAQWPVALAADAPEFTGTVADPSAEQTAVENHAVEFDSPSEDNRGLTARLLDWFPSWFTPAQPPVAPAADAPEIAEEAPDPDEVQAAAENDAVELGRLSKEDRGLIALLNMREQGNAFVGQWEITAAGKARWVPSRVVILGGTELLIPGLTALERRIVQEREVDWQTYGLALVDIAAIASGATLLRFATKAGRIARPTRVDVPTLRSGSLAAAKVLGIKAVRYGLPVGLVVMMIRYPRVFTQYLWHLGGIIGVLIGWGIVIVPIAFLLSWMLLSVRVLRFAGRLLAGAARGCQWMVVRLAVPDRR